ncbi:MAG TPA: S9 family peptidase [Gemmatimonadales bacterium]|nr:S9 family peptidase [Gemmatimonadales bacterium]
MSFSRMRRGHLARAALPIVALAFPLSPTFPQAPARRAFSLDDLARIRTITEPAISPDGAWVSYTVTTVDSARDREQSDIWMTSWDGTRTVRLTSSPESEHGAAWSPDGRWLAFLSDRGDPHENDQLWLLDRAGGEAERITGFPGGIDDFAWAPDGKRLALVVEDPERDTVSADTGSAKGAKRPLPIVLDRFQFKEDETGYLDQRRKHLYLLDVATRRGQQLTSGTHDEVLPSWSPDGSTIAFVTKRGADPDRTDNWDIYTVAAEPGGAERQVTTYEGADSDPDLASRPAWSPDGKAIAYTQGGPPKLIDYGVPHLAVVPAVGGAAKPPAPALDRWVKEPRWASSGRDLLFLLEDDRNVQLARVPAEGGSVERVVTGRRVLSDIAVGPDDRVAVLAATPDAPAEVFAVERDGSLRALSHQNDDWLKEISLATTDEISFRSRDGTQINGLLVKPPGWAPGSRYPTVLRIHGGPVLEVENEFNEQWQWLASRGYVVIAVNPRGSSGRGEKFASAIFADWGHKDAQDVLAAVDYAVREGIADPNRLGIGGWSYGGMLTNYVIAQDQRFKAAISGAGISNILAGYGTDQYVREYETELGLPWKHTDRWLKLSFPFLHADRIVTPTLFLCGDRDFNVPLLNSEQMYQALRSLGRETELVIYPGEYHTIRRPSFVRDRLKRYAEWYDRFLKQGTLNAEQ